MIPCASEKPSVRPTRAARSPDCHASIRCPWRLLRWYSRSRPDATGRRKHSCQPKWSSPADLTHPANDTLAATRYPWCADAAKLFERAFDLDCRYADLGTFLLEK